MNLLELHDYITAIYSAGWQDAIEGRKFDPQIPAWLQQRSENHVEARSIAPQDDFIPSEGQDSGSSEIVA